MSSVRSKNAKTLNNVADVCYGKRQNEVVDDFGQFPIVGTGGVFGTARIPLFKGPAIIVGRKGTLDAPQYMERDFWTVDTAYAVLPKEGTHAKWLYYVLSASRLETLNESTGVPSLSRDRLYAVPIRDISYTEQTRIAAVLDTVGEAIAKTEAMIAKLRQVRAGLLHDLLTCGLDEHGQLRDPIAHPEQFQDSSIGRIPKVWDWEPLSKLCSHIGSGVTPRGGQDVYTTTGVMLIRSQNVRFEGLLLDDVAFISDDIHKGMLRSEVFAYDVLFNITGASIGRCCPMPEGLGRANVNQHVCILRIPQADINVAKFLACILSSPIGQRQMDALNTMGNRQGLNYQQLGSFIVPWPKGDELEKVVKNINGFEAQIDAEIAECDKLNQLKSGLMDDLLTGRVRVSEGVACGG